MLKGKKITNIFAFSALTLITFNAQAIIIDFEDNAQASGTYTTESSDVISRGFLFDFDTNHGHLSNDANFGTPENPAVSNGTTYLVADDYVGTSNLTMTSLAGGIFDLGSLDLAEWAQSDRGAGRVDITGTLSGGGIVSTSFILDGIYDGVGGVDDFQSLVLNWTNLTQVVFKGYDSFTGEDYFSVDNIDTEIRNVPEPASLALLGLGLMGVGFSSRKKRQ